MNEKNVDYLKNQLFSLGFKDKLNDVLEKAIYKELPSFSIGLNTRKKGEKGNFDHLRYELNFSQSKETGLYFLNDYLVTLRKHNEPWPRIQVFDLERHHRITALEAYNLLSGRSVCKDILRKKEEKERPSGTQQEKAKKISIWVKLNMDVTGAYNDHPFQRFYPEYDYLLDQSLAKYPLIGLDNTQKMEDLLKDLKKGNLVETELSIKGKVIPVFITANPQMKTIDIYDKELTRLRDEDIFPGKKKEANEAVSEVKSTDDIALKAEAPQQSPPLPAKPWEREEQTERHMTSRSR